MAKYKVIETRMFTGLGLRHTGDIVELPAEIGQQFCDQGFVEELAAKASVERANARTNIQQGVVAKTAPKTEE